MPLVRGIRVLVVHIFCSPDGLASQPLRNKANQHDETEDAESQEGYHDDVHPPHVDHRNLTIYLTFPEKKAAHRVVGHTWSNEVACRPLTQLGHLAVPCKRRISVNYPLTVLLLAPIGPYSSEVQQTRVLGREGHMQGT
jgi:hypothetical protein